jgi:hypothetical protein
MSRPWILVPALGTDERLFWPLLTATGWANVRVMPLPHPLAATQLSAYARLLATGLPPAGEYNLLGVSFGASVAVEVALVRPPARLVVVSGAKTVRELPPWVRLAPHLLRHPQFRPEWLRALAQPEWMGIRESTERQLFRDMLAGTPTRLLHWAFNALGTWSNHVTPPRTLHLHGAADLLLPAAFAHGSQKIRGAGHWAIFTHAPEIARHIGG